MVYADDHVAMPIQHGIKRDRGAMDDTDPRRGDVAFTDAIRALDRSDRD